MHCGSSGTEMCWEGRGEGADLGQEVCATHLKHLRSFFEEFCAFRIFLLDVFFIALGIIFLKPFLVLLNLINDCPLLNCPNSGAHVLISLITKDLLVLSNKPPLPAPPSIPAPRCHLLPSSHCLSHLSSVKLQI